MNSTNLYGREIRFYAELAGKVSITTPQVYYSASDEDSGDHVLIMEDMSYAQNGDDLLGRSREDALFCVRQLARLHADWWDDTRISEFPGQHQISDQHQPRFQRSWRLCMEKVGADLSPSFITICDLLTNRIGEISSALTSRPQTLIHGDFRYDNIFFSQNDGAVQLTLIDWQLVERACAAYDVSYFVASSLHIHQRREIEDDLLAAYHDTLIDCGIRDYSISDLLNDYRLSFIRFIELWVEAGAYLDLTNPRGHAYFLESIARLDAIFEDHDILSIIERRIYT
jgi:aminoglycoside/choline kinase family phosphotransferase